MKKSKFTEQQIPYCLRQDESRIPVEAITRKMGLPDLHLDATCLDHLQRYSWPGNVRELENALERAAVLCRKGVILPEDLPDSVIESTIQPLSGGS